MTKADIRPLALIIPAYNEATVIGHTITSAIRAGLPAEHIYIVDDASTDETSDIAIKLVGPDNVHRVQRSGKGKAIHKIVQKLKLTRRYRWIHIADADGEFHRDYFTELQMNLKETYAAATGYVASLDGGIISKYRAYEYAVGMDIVRRFQALTGLITIIPGPTSMFRSDVFRKLDFTDDVLCEDFDVTLQLHRLRLGKIQFIPSAIARTQDPATFKDFIKQITRWNRGVLQMLFKHHIGSKATKIDFYLLYQVSQNILLGLTVAVMVPLIVTVTGNVSYAAILFLADVMLMMVLVLFSVGRLGRLDILAAFPLIYALRWVSLVIFFKCFVEVVFLEKYRNTPGVWETVERRQQKTADSAI